MKKELDEVLCAKYPKLFRDRHAPMTTTCMCWGFECGDGWYNIIDALCSNIQHHIDWKRKQRLIALRFNRALQKAIDGDNGVALEKYYSANGKYSLSARQQENIDEEIKGKKFRKVPNKVEQVIVSQVKEKFGTLRFYVDRDNDEIHAMINMAESMSARTCEVCGSPGKSNSRGWIKTLCETHRNEKEKQYA